METRKDPEVQLSAVNVPAQVRQGEPFRVEVVVDSNHDDEGNIEVYRGAIKVVSEKRKIKKGENRFVFQQQIDNDRLADFTARARGFKDTLLDNNADSGLVFTAGKPRVLIVESDPSTAKHLAWALEEQEMQVNVRPPQGMPSDLSDLQNYELLILSNVPATSLTLKQMQVARTYVQDLGGGLIMIGGDQSFGLGGYYKTTIEEILPVRSDFEKEKEKPSLAMVLVIDHSGSMGGEKIEMAKEAARSAVELLGPNDKVGVIAFDDQAYIVSEIHPCSDKGYVVDRIASIEAGGGTSMYPAMEEAYDALRETTAKLKHVIILTDGISAPGDFEGIRENDVAEPNHGDDRGRRQRRRSNSTRRDCPDRRRPFLRGARPGLDPANIREGDRHREQVGNQRIAVQSASRATFSDPFRPRFRDRAAAFGLRRHSAETDERADPWDRERRPVARLVALRLGHERRVHVRRQDSLGRRMGFLARLRQILGTDRSSRPAQKARRKGSSPRSFVEEARHSSRLTRSTPPAAISTRPRANSPSSIRSSAARNWR